MLSWFSNPIRARDRAGLGSGPIGVIVVAYAESVYGQRSLVPRIEVLAQQMRQAGIEDVYYCPLRPSRRPYFSAKMPSLPVEDVEHVDATLLPKQVDSRPVVFVDQSQYHVPKDWIADLLARAVDSGKVVHAEGAVQTPPNHAYHLRLKPVFFAAPAAWSKTVCKALIDGNLNPITGLAKGLAAINVPEALVKITRNNIGSIYGQAVTLEKPVNFVVEPNNSCNYRCIMCPYHGGRQNDGPAFVKPGTYVDMPLDTFKRIIDEIAEMERPYEDETEQTTVTPYRRGELKLYPHWREALAYIKSKPNLRVYFSTNGSDWTDDDIEYLLDIGIDHIQVSLNGHNIETHGKVRLNKEFNKVASTALRLVKRRIERGLDKPFVQVCNIFNDRTIPEIPAYVEFWQKRVDCVFINPENKIEKENQNKQFIMEFAPLPLSEEIEQPPCSMLRDYIWIDAGGDTHLCIGAKTLQTGDIYESSVEEILNAPLRRQVLTDHILGKYDNPVCRNCTQWYSQIYQTPIETDDFTLQSGPAFKTYYNKHQPVVDDELLAQFVD